MNSRERVMASLNFRPVDRLPKDLGGMRSTGISAFSYPKLVAALGLPERPPKVHDTGQMLALPDRDVLDALGCDVVTAEGDVTNAFDQPELWKPYDFGGRLDALVRAPDSFRTEPDGTVVQGDNSRMVPASYVFDGDHAGQPMLEFDKPLPLIDLAEHRERSKKGWLGDEELAQKIAFYKRTRESTDRAILTADWRLQARIGIGGHAGIAVFPVICMLEPDYVKEYHEIQLEGALNDIGRLLPEIEDYVDVVLVSADDWGSQQNLFASPEVYRDLFLPYYRKATDLIHRLAPGAKTFIHTCGAVYDVLDLMVESGFDAINPIQWQAGDQAYQDWKKKLRGRAAMWGGGVNSQHTLPLGTVADIEREVTEVVREFREDSGFIFCNIHNLLAEISPEKVIALYRAATEA